MIAHALVRGRLESPTAFFFVMGVLSKMTGNFKILAKALFAVARGCSSILPYDQHTISVTSLEIGQYVIGREYIDRDMGSKNSLFSALTCHNYDKSLKMSILR